MKSSLALFVCLSLQISPVLASEVGYFYCTSQTEFYAVKVSQVITNNSGRISSTFKLDVWDPESNKTLYWQSGNVRLSSNNTLSGRFEDDRGVSVEVDLKAPTFPDYKPRQSFLVRDEITYSLDCHRL